MLTPRLLQRRLAPVGNIRLGVNDDPSRRRPQRSETFVITTPSERIAQAVAARYGGTATPWHHPTKGQNQHRVITTATTLAVYASHQIIDPWFEMWAEGPTLTRRCDGQTEILRGRPCLCDPEGTMGRNNPLRSCKISIRLSVTLADIPTIGSFTITSSGWNAVDELSAIGEALQRLPLGAYWPGTLLMDRRTANIVTLDDRGREVIRPRVYTVPVLALDGVSMRDVVEGTTALQALCTQPTGEAATLLIKEIEEATSRDEMVEIHQRICEANIAHIPELVAAWYARKEEIQRATEPENDDQDPDPADDNDNDNADTEMEPKGTATIMELLTTAGGAGMTRTQLEELCTETCGKPLSQLSPTELGKITTTLEG